MTELNIPVYTCRKCSSPLEPRRSFDAYMRRVCISCNRRKPAEDTHRCESCNVELSDANRPTRNHRTCKGCITKKGLETTKRIKLGLDTHHLCDRCHDPLYKRSYCRFIPGICLKCIIQDPVLDQHLTDAFDRITGTTPPLC